MLPFEGWIREKIGRTVHTAVLVRNVGTSKEIRKEVINGKEMPEKEVTIIHWRKVAQRYFKPNETFWEYDDMHAFYLLVENETIGRGEVHVQYIDFDTGDHLFFGGRVLASPQSEPMTLRRAIHTKHLVAFMKENAINFQWVIFLLGFVVGAAVFFTIGQNANAIGHALSNIHIG